MKTNYEIAGDTEREKLTKFFTMKGITDYEFTPANGTNTVDGFFTMNGRKFVLEAKVRTCPIDQFFSHLLQKDKYEQLKSYHAQGYEPLYFNFFPEGLIVYNLSTRIVGKKMVFKPLPCKANTVNAGGDVERLGMYLVCDGAKWKDRKYDIIF